MPVSASQQIVGNYRTITSNEAFLTSSVWTFSTLTTGAQGAHTVFTVTGDVFASVVAVCNTSLTGANATIEAGLAGNTAVLLPQLTATTFDATMSWGYLAAIDNPAIGLPVISHMSLIGAGLDILLTIGTAAVTGGVVNFYCTWRPLSSDGRITVTTPA